MRLCHSFLVYDTSLLYSRIDVYRCHSPSFILDGDIEHDRDGSGRWKEKYELGYYFHCPHSPTSFLSFTNGE